MGRNRLGWVGVVAALALGAAAARSAETAPAEKPSLAELVDAYERTEKELADLQVQSKAARTTPESQRIQNRIQELQALQEKWAAAIEQRVGPLAPAVRPDPAAPLESQVEAHEQRHDTVLEKDIEKRLR